MNALILLAHGSRREESNNEVAALTEKIKKLSDNEYAHIEHAFLEIKAPSLLEAIDNSISIGATKITVFPYFLNSGKHVQKDIPEMIETAEIKHPNCSFNVTACIGMMEDMPRLILEQIRNNQ